MSTPHNATLGLSNPQAEGAVLHCMMDNTQAAIALGELLEPADFEDGRRGLVFEAIHSLLLGIEPIDSRSILAECARLVREKGVKFVIDEAFLEGLEPVDARRYEMYGNTVKKLAWLRKAGDFAFWLAQELQGRPKPDSLFAAAMEQWQRLAPKNVKSKFVYGWDTEEEHRAILKERIRRFEQGINSRFDWPWASWNRIIRPLQPGFLGIIGAADGVGKTTYLEEIAEYWARQGLHVVYVHLEDHLDYKRDRRLCRHAQVAIEHIQDGTLTDQEKAQIEQARQYIDGWKAYLHYLDAAGESMNSILAELEAKVSEGVVDAVIIDYIDKCQASRGQMQLFGGNVWERQANDMEQLKIFVSKHGIVGLTATQGNKGMYGNRTQTRDGIAGSIQKSQKAQLVVLVKRQLLGDEGMTGPNGVRLAEPGEYSPYVDVRVDKQNIGRTGEFRQFFKGQYFRVRDLKVEADQPALDRTLMAKEPMPTPYKDD